MTHPFGPMVDRHLAHKAVTERLMASLQDEISTCGRAKGCVNPIHHPACPEHPRHEEYMSRADS